MEKFKLKNILFIRNMVSFRHRYIFLQCDVEIAEQATVFFVGQVLWNVQ